jgi:hypothetical protein
MPERFTLSQAASLIGVAPITLKRWLLARKVDEVPRDRNGWRVFTRSDVNRIKRFADAIHPPTAIE